MFNETYTATFGGGCFWCLEAIFLDLQGVVSVESGYTGGKIPQPTYKQVCTENTGHAEVVQIKFNPEIITFRDLLNVFFSIHDPTTLNRQGADIGSQYRSAIFYHDQEQKLIAQNTIAELDQAGLWAKPIVTEVTPLDRFYMAEAYHQDYYANNSSQPYCQAVIAPKISKFRQKFVDHLKISNQ